MRYILDAAQMKEIDAYSINNIGIPSVVLMERAALSVTKKLIKQYDRMHTDKRILCVCGSGNNGADGLAVARQLYLKGYKVDVALNEGGHPTEEYRIQLNIIRNLGIQYIDGPDFSAYGVIVDALFGNGLSRKLEGKALQMVETVNSAHAAGAYVAAVDIPSGISASSGAVMGNAVMADMTITFGYIKTGQLLYPGAQYCGRLETADIGFAEYDKVPSSRYMYEPSDIVCNLPVRKPDSNKGSCGKTLIIAGSKQYAGAALLSSRAAYRMGSGLVRLVTHADNRNIVLTGNAECLVDTYEDTLLKERAMDKYLDWADAVCIGPGLSLDMQAEEFVRAMIKAADKKRLFDADALNIIAGNNLSFTGGNIVVTPHIGEMSRLTGKSIPDIKKDIIGTAVDYARTQKCICVLKDARTVVTDGDEVYINTSGNDGMATGGSGDVLSGIITSLMSQGMECFAAAKLGVYIHGLAGDMAASKKGRYSMLAGDIIENISEVINNEKDNY